MPHRFLALAALVGALMATGCGATSYVPSQSPRVSIIANGGNYAYVRDGTRYSDIVDAVAGNAQAEEYAREYKSGTTIGTTLLWGGILVAAAGLGVVVVDDAQNPNQQSLSPAGTAGFVIAGTGLVVELIGAIVKINALPRQLDAINAFNDSLESPRNMPER